MMAAQTKMIIITSNENVIRQFSSNKSLNTRIIDLDNEKQVTSMSNDNNHIINLGLLAELSELNSNSDQVYKRVLEIPHYDQTKPVKASRKSVDLMCTICGDRAIGFNYDALSCASCKAFFRRNACQQSEKLRCLTGHGQCSVAYSTRRKCQRCRLDRCFAMGMRRDFIRTDEEKQRRKKRLEENRNITITRSSTSKSTNSLSPPNPLTNSDSLPETFKEIDRLLMDVDGNDDNIVFHESTDSNETEDTSLEILSVENWVTIQKIRSSFLSLFQHENVDCPFGDAADRASGLISWSQFANQISLRFINFFRQIDEFEGLHGDDRFILTKYNLLSLFPIFKCLNYNRINDCCTHGENEAAQKTRQFFILCDQSVDVCDKFVNLIVLLVQVTEQDPTFLSLLLTILIFSQSLSMNAEEPPLQDSMAVNRAQFHYTELLWKYLVNKSSDAEACRLFTQILTIIFQIQLAAKRFREFFRAQLILSNAVDKIAPLMQTVLHIS